MVPSFFVLLDLFEIRKKDCKKTNVHFHLFTGCARHLNGWTLTHALNGTLGTKLDKFINNKFKAGFNFAVRNGL